MVAKGVYFDAGKNRLSIARRNIIYVEGADDAYFFDRMLSDLNIAEDDVRIELISGTGGIPASLRELVKSSYYIRKEILKICFVRDADADASIAEREFQDACLSVGLPRVRNGTIEGYDADRFLGFYTLPEPGENGDLEKMLLDGVSGTKRHEIAKTCFDAAAAELGPLNRETKRMAQIFMAIHPEECRGVGRAYALNAFPSSPQVVVLREFIRNFLEG